MAIFSDSDFSAAQESSDDDDFKMSDHESDNDDDLDLENEKTKAVREGFSLHRSVDSTPGAKINNEEWLSTQPSSAAKNRRVSPRSSNKPKGITGAIVGAIKGDVDSLVIPRKKKPPPKQQTVVPTTSTDQAQPQQPPMKKRKVSLSPTDSLAKKRTSLVGDEAKRKQVINLLLDDDSDSDDEILAFKRDRLTKPEIVPARLSPSMLAAAKQQQKEHVEATKQKKSESDNAISKSTETKPPKSSLSKISGVSYAEQSGDKPPEIPLVTSCAETSKTKQTKRKVRPLPTSATNTNNNNTTDEVPSKSSKTEESKSKTKKTKAKKSVEAKLEETKNDVPEKILKAKETKTEKGNAKTDAPAKSSIESKSDEKNKSPPTETKSVSKTTKAATTKTNKKDAEVSATTKTTKETTKTSAAAAKPPPKKKKKRITFEDELLQKMFMTCRPYSVRDLVQLMGKTTSEASINFCLLSLIDKKWITKKEFKSGTRTKELYWANQNTKDKKLWALECLQLPTADKIRETRLELATVQQKQKSLAKEIEDVEKTPSNEQLCVLCETAQTQVDELSKKLNAMKQRITSSSSSATVGKTKPQPLGFRRNLLQKQKPKKAMTPLQLKKRINVMRDHWIKRKRKCMDFCDQLADGMEKKVKDVVHKVLELETDESENAVLPPKHVV